MLASQKYIPTNYNLYTPQLLRQNIARQSGNMVLKCFYVIQAEQTVTEDMSKMLQNQSK